MPEQRSRFRRTWLAWAVLLGGTLSVAQDQYRTTTPIVHNQVPNLPAQELVRRAVGNEEKPSARKIRFIYCLTSQSPKGAKTQEMIETNEGVVGRLIAVNGQPPTADQRRVEDEKLRKLLNDPEARAKKRKAQKDDEQRVTKMVMSLPDAFTYNYDGTALGPQGELVRLTFVPNPNWNPPDRERQVFTGMKGFMLIDPRQERLVKIQATLFRDVNFGWGIFGHLDKGGQFIVEQSNIGGDRWETTDMRLRFTGKVLLFKNLNIDEHETAANFREVSPNLSFVQGVETLKKQDRELAQKSEPAK